MKIIIAYFIICGILVPVLCAMGLCFLKIKLDEERRFRASRKVNRKLKDIDK